MDGGLFRIELERSLELCQRSDGVTRVAQFDSPADVRLLGGAHLHREGGNTEDGGESEAHE